MVFLEIQMYENVVVPSDMLKFPSPPHRKVILFNLLHKLSHRKASKEHGYYIAATRLNAIYAFRLDELTDGVVFPVSFHCTTVKPCRGEILVGTVNTILQDGIVLHYGPMKNIFLSKTEMKDYELRMSEEPMFSHLNGWLYLKKDTKVRFRVLDVKWIESNKEFSIQATILGDYLGPI